MPCLVIQIRTRSISTQTTKITREAFFKILVCSDVSCDESVACAPTATATCISFTQYVQTNWRTEVERPVSELRENGERLSVNSLASPIKSHLLQRVALVLCSEACYNARQRVSKTRLPGRKSRYSIRKHIRLPPVRVIPPAGLKGYPHPVSASGKRFPATELHASRGFRFSLSARGERFPQPFLLL